jgi:hypothetical protein
VILFRLHPFGRDAPDLGIVVDLAPPGTYHLADAAGRQNYEFECLRRDTLLFPQIIHETADLGMIERRMVFDAPNLVFLW